MRVLLVAVADLPHGGGGTRRLVRLAEAMVHGGHDVRIVLEHPLGVAPPAMIQHEGTAGSIPFEYLASSQRRTTGFRMIPAKVMAVARLSWRLLVMQTRPDVVWFNNLSLYDTLPLTLICRMRRIATIQAYEDERLETVSTTRSTLARRTFRLNSELSDRVSPRLANAIVVISRFLQLKYQAVIRDPSRVHLIPTVINAGDWHCQDATADQEPVILYSGTFGEQDDVAGLIEASIRLWETGHRFRIVLLGDNKRRPSIVKGFQTRLKRSGFEARADFPGFVTEDEMQKRICSADLLYAVRNNNVFAKSGLSTKLSEFLASNRPVLATAMGDVPFYLEDGVSAFLLPPGAGTIAIAKGISEILALPQERRRLVGHEGGRVAQKYFDTPVVARTLGQIMDYITGP